MTDCLWMRFLLFHSAGSCLKLSRLRRVSECDDCHLMNGEDSFTIRSHFPVGWALRHLAATRLLRDGSGAGSALAEDGTRGDCLGEVRRAPKVRDGFGRPMRPRDRLPQGGRASPVKLSYVTLFVQDFAACRRFYAELLGLPIETETPNFVLFAPPGGARLGLHRARGDHVTRGADLHFEMADVDAAYDELKAKGAPFKREPVNAPWGHRVATLEDPAGNHVEIYTPIAGT